MVNVDNLELDNGLNDEAGSFSRRSLLFGLFIAPTASVDIVKYLYSGQGVNSLSTTVVLALLLWLPINPISISSVLVVVGRLESTSERVWRLAISWAGLVSAIIVGHSYLAVGVANIRQLF